MKFFVRKIIPFSIAIVCTSAIISIAQAAPNADLWPVWEKHDPESKKQINHSKWNDFLRSYLVSDTPSGINLLKYSSVTSKDRNKLKSYLSHLQNIKISKYNRDVQFAYWVNLYNALTVNLILENYPVSSITDISSGWFSMGPWNKKIAEVEGKKLSLNDIEHRILRPIWNDKRIHYAVNCASMGCPNLQPKAFTSKNSEKLLNKTEKIYINSPRGVQFKNGYLRISKIYKWYYSDFGKSESDVLDYLSNNIKRINPDILKNYTGSIYYHYDWSLNEYKAKE